MEMAEPTWRQHLAVIEPDSKVIDKCVDHMRLLSAQDDNLEDDTMWQALCQSPERTEKQLTVYLDRLLYVQQRKHSIATIEVKSDLDTPQAKKIAEQYALFHGYENVEIARIIPIYLALAEEVLRLKTTAEAAYNAASLDDRARYYSTLRFLQQQYISLIAYKENLLENVLLRLESLARLGQQAKPLAAYAAFHGITLPIVSHGYLPLDNWQVSHFLTFYQLLSTHATGEQARRLAAIDWQLGHLYYRDDGVLVLCPHLYKSSDLYLHKPWFSSIFTGKQVLYDLFTNPYDLLQLHKAIDVIDKQVEKPIQLDGIITFLQQSYTALEQVEIEKKRVETAISGLWWVFSAHPMHVANTWIDHLKSKRVRILQSISAQYAKVMDNPALCHQLAASSFGEKLATLAADCEVESVSMVGYMPETITTSLHDRIARSFCLLLLDKSSNTQEAGGYLEQFFSTNHEQNIIAIIGRDAYTKYAHAYKVIKQLSVSNYVDMVEVIDYLTDNVDMSVILSSLDSRFSEAGNPSLILHQAALNYLYSVHRKRSSWIFQSIKSLVPLAIAEKLRMPAIQPYIAERMPTVSALHNALAEGELPTIPCLDSLRYEAFVCPKSSKQLQDAITQYVGRSPEYSKELAQVVLSYGSLDSGIDYICTFVLQKMDAGKSIIESLQDFPIPILDGQYPSVLDEVYSMLDEYIVSQLEAAVVHNDETICTRLRQWMDNIPCSQSGEPVVSGWRTILSDLVGSSWSPLRAEIMWQLGSKADKAQYNLHWLPIILYGNRDYPIDNMVQFYSDKQRRYRHWWSCFGGDDVASYSLSCYSSHVLQQSMVSRPSVEMMNLLFLDPMCVSYYKLTECEETYHIMQPRWQQQQYLIDDVQLIYQTSEGAVARAALERVVSQMEQQPLASESIAAYKQLSALLWQHIATQVQQAIRQGEIMPLALYEDLLQRLVALPIQEGIESKQYSFLVWLSSVSAYISTASIKVAYGVEHNQPISSWLNSLTLYLLVIDVYPATLRQHMVQRLDHYTGMIHVEGLLSFWGQQMQENFVSDDPFCLGERLIHAMEQHLGTVEEDKPCQSIYEQLLSECDQLSNQYQHHSFSFEDRRFLETSIATLMVIAPQMQEPQRGDCMALQQRMTRLLERPYIPLEDKPSVAIHASLFFHPTTTKELSLCQKINQPQH